MSTPTENPEIVDAQQVIADLAAHAVAQGDHAAPILQGTFAMYPMEDGGVMVATNITEGPMAGVKHIRIAPALIAAGTALTGGSKMGALKALMGGKRGR